ADPLLGRLEPELVELAEHDVAQAGAHRPTFPRRRRPCHPSPVRPSLYDFAGGDSAFLALATPHHARCLADPELNHPFSHPGQHPRHVERLAAYWAEVMGGPPVYSRSCGDQSGLLHMHSGNGDMTDL